MEGTNLSFLDQQLLIHVRWKPWLLHYTHYIHASCIRAFHRSHSLVSFPMEEKEETKQAFESGRDQDSFVQHLHLTGQSTSFLERVEMASCITLPFLSDIKLYGNDRCGGTC